MHRLVLILAFLVLQLVPANAQQDQARDQVAATISRAEAAIESGRASVEALDALRSDLDAIRETTSDTVEDGSVQARTIEAQIEALGPEPAENENEPDAIATRREELQNQLAEANRPIREAQAQLNQVELLIRELDRLVRQKSTRKLLQRFPSILMPDTLTTGIQELAGVGGELADDIRQGFGSDDFNARRTETLVGAALLAIVGLTLVFGVRWVQSRFLDYKFEHSTRRKRLFWAVLSSLISLVLPTLGMVALATIVPVLGFHSRIFDYSGQFVLHVLVVIVIANWLGQTVFAPGAPSRRLLNLDDQMARRGLHLCRALGLIEAAELFAEAISIGLLDYRETISTLAVPIIFVVSFLLWQLASLLRRGLKQQQQAAEAAANEDSNEVNTANKGLVNVLIFLLRASAIVVIPLVLAGYVNLARHVSDAMVMSTALLGFALFIYTVIVVGIRAMTGHSATETEETLPLLPFVVGFLLMLGTLPLLALIWGARTADVAEIWRLIIEGVEVGGVTLSLGVVVSLLVVFGLGAIATRWLQRGLRETVLPRTRLDTGARNALVTGIGYVGLTLSALIAASAAGLSMSSLAVVAGALSLGIGFGLQTIVSNFVSGIILLIERPIAEGDWIEVSGHSGIVKKIAVRSTQISTFDKHDVIVPNQDLIASSVKNMTLSSRHGRLIIPVGVAYGSDLEKTKEILEQAAADQSTLLKYPAPVVLFRGLGDSSLDFELRCYLADVDNLLGTQSDLLFRIYIDLDKAGIEIPFPQRDVNLRGASIQELISGDAKPDIAPEDPDGSPAPA
ncbi:mechanosensitive ion channel family protein [Rhodobacteraceae bacterium F11138]|nr:mechanosensitive ion channel family protein [Rhodobacteraceae bacterium F11138]